MKGHLLNNQRLENMTMMDSLEIITFCGQEFGEFSKLND